MKFKLISIAILFSLLYSCNILDISPENTVFKLISCKINGKKWIPGAPEGYTVNGSLIDGLVYSDQVSIYAYRGYHKSLLSSVLLEDELIIMFSAEGGNGKKEINENNHFIEAKLSITEEKDVIKTYFLDHSAGGFLDIKDYQPENDFCGGEFEFTLKEKDSGELLKVTNGRFKISTTESFW